MIKFIILLLIFLNYNGDCSSISKRDSLPDLCKSSPCQNNGTCVQPDENLYIAYCNCSLQYTGVFCEIEKKFCQFNECKNGGTCNQDEKKCDCQGYFYGEKCENQIKLCESNPCENDSKCLIVLDEIFCLCIGKYEGKFCEKPKES